MKVRIKKLTPTAKVPTRNKGNGFDIYADEDIMLHKGSLTLISTGISSSFKNGVILFKDRSSMAMKGIEVRAGVIDEIYRGEWKVLLRNNGPRYKISKGDRIAQAVVIPQPTVFFDEVTELDITERAYDGFGSTGK